jgi:polygalacturonase
MRRTRVAVLVVGLLGLMLTPVAWDATTEAKGIHEIQHVDFKKRPARSRASVIFTPEQFGAVGNGKHNDTAAVQAAITAAAGKGVVLLSAHRTYLCTKSLIVPSNSTIRGTNTTAVLSFNWIGAVGPASGGAGYITTASNKSNSHIIFYHFTVQGYGSGQPSGPNALYPNRLTPGVNLYSVSVFTITDLHVQDVPGISIEYHGSQYGTIAHNYVHNSGRDGITGFWDPPNLDNIKVDNNYIADVGDDAIALNGAPTPPPVNTLALPYNLTVSNNTIHGWPSNVNGRTLGRGILLDAVAGATVTDNSITNTFSSGIAIEGSQNPATAVDKNPATNAPWLSTDVTVDNNTIINAGQLDAGSTIGPMVGNQPRDGIYINGAENATIKGNTVMNSQSQAIDNEACDPNCSVQ